MFLTGSTKWGGGGGGGREEMRHTNCKSVYMYGGVGECTALHTPLKSPGVMQLILSNSDLHVKHLFVFYLVKEV